MVVGVVSVDVGVVTVVGEVVVDVIVDVSDVGVVDIVVVVVLIVSVVVVKVKGVVVGMHWVTILTISPFESHRAVKHAPFPSVVL